MNILEILSQKKIIREEDVAKLKSKILKIPYKKISPNSISEDIFKLIPFESAKNYMIVPISRDKDILVVGMVDPTNPSAQEALKFLAKQAKINLGVYIVTPSDVDLILRKFSKFSAEIQSALQSLDIKPGEGLAFSQRITKLEEGMESGSVDAPIIRIVSSLFN